jgi:copper resistance protein C
MAPPAVVALLVVASVLGLAASAQAHNYLVDSNPKSDEILTELPEHFSVTTNAALLDLKKDGTGSGIEIIDADGLYYGDGCVTVEGSSVYATPAIGEPGEYRFVWQVVSSDGHPVSDEFTFIWQPSSDYEKTTGTTEPGDCNGLYLRNGVKADSNSEESTPVDVTDALWILSAGLAVTVAAALTFLVVKPRRKK